MKFAQPFVNRDPRRFQLCTGDSMSDMTLRVLRMFDQLKKETLDLHELFEAGGNDPEARTEVFHTVESLVEAGLLEERGNDFYALTTEGQKVAQSAIEDYPEGN